MDDNHSHGKPSRLDSLSFLLGDWRGKGQMTFEDGPVIFEHRRRSRMTADGSRLEIVSFSDNSADEMFNGEHSFIYVDTVNGELRLKRQWFLESGFNETTERVKVAEDGNSVKLEGIPDLSRGPAHRGTIRKSGETTLLMEGEVVAGDRHMPYRTELTRRMPKP